MILPDVNVLLHATNHRVAQHRAAKLWLDAALNGNERVGLAWVVLLGFLRISTRPGIFPTPLTILHASNIVRELLASTTAEVVSPGPDHALTLTRLLSSAGTAGNLVTDAHIAALAIEHGAEVVTFDRDFGRFKGLRWRLLQVP